MSSSAPLIRRNEEEDDRRWRWMRWLSLDMEEARAQVRFAIPMIITSMSYYAIPLISVMFAGHLGDTELAGSTLANSWCAVTGLALMTGLSGSLETLCGQAFGAKLYKSLGVNLQAAMLTSLCFSILVSVLWTYTEPVLIWLHQDQAIAHMAGIYLKYLIPSIFAYGFIQCIQRFLQTQTLIKPLVIWSAVPLFLHIGITYLLVHVLGLGFKGAPLATSLSLWISFFMLAIYIVRSEKCKYTWQGFSSDSFKYIIPNIKLAIPSAIMVCLEYWAFELLVLLAGLMSNSEYTTSLLAMCVNTEAIVYMITYGLAAVVSTRVSNEMGSGNYANAKIVVSVTMKLSVGLALTVILLLAIGHRPWAHLFSGNPMIINGFASMTPLLALSILFDSAQGVLSGVARGCGWQHLAAWTNLVAFYGVGMPLAILFAFKLNLSVKGLWLGLICGLGTQACILLIITLRTKWKRLDLSEA